MREKQDLDPPCMCSINEDVQYERGISSVLVRMCSIGEEHKDQ